MQKSKLFQLMASSFVLFTSVICSAATANNLLIDDIAKVMGAFNGNISITDATEHGKLRWALWEAPEGDAKRCHLALFSMEKNKASQRWSTSWADSYAPRIDQFAEWSWHGNPIITIHLQFGAASEHLEFYSLDANNKPVKLDEADASTSSWIISHDNDSDTSLLVLYHAEPVVLKAECYGWDQQTGKLVSKACQ
jgi:hypothetical protein